LLEGQNGGQLSIAASSLALLGLRHTAQTAARRRLCFDDVQNVASSILHIGRRAKALDVRWFAPLRTSSG